MKCWNGLEVVYYFRNKHPWIYLDGLRPQSVSNDIRSVNDKGLVMRWRKNTLTAPFQLCFRKYWLSLTRTNQMRQFLRFLFFQTHFWRRWLNVCEVYNRLRWEMLVILLVSGIKKSFKIRVGQNIPWNSLTNLYFREQIRRLVFGILDHWQNLT